ncbi:MYO7A [Branchiostoma lanceolatum]|uniref:MYO7A protein n=1 Tax=Branchiostoma lanceolatum TaxID=7740 RepID=A0A8J9YYM6_BRALA|nr:MYO7A [Branchiostoma lanceolatum]
MADDAERKISLGDLEKKTSIDHGDRPVTTDDDTDTDDKEIERHLGKTSAPSRGQRDRKGLNLEGLTQGLSTVQYDVEMVDSRSVSPCSTNNSSFRSAQDVQGDRLLVPDSRSYNGSRSSQSGSHSPSERSASPHISFVRDIGPLAAADREEAGEDVTQEFTYEKFAKANYREGTRVHRQVEPLHEPLLPYKTREDKQAALENFMTILRFMGEIQEETDDISREDVSPGDSVSRQSSPGPSSPTVESPVNSALRRAPQIDLGLLGLTPAEINQICIIVGNGIISSNLRTEIYCQLCKQLSKNPSSRSQERGWLLMSACVSCFLPSHQPYFLKCLVNYILTAGGNRASFCERRLRRTLENGTRSLPPSWFELQAICTMKPLQVPVTLMDGNTVRVLMDSASTIQEITHQVAKKVGIRDKFGFCLYMTVSHQVYSLGDGHELIMDDIAEIELGLKNVNKREVSWELYLRKELFAPWQDPSDDKFAADLVFQQVVGGIRFEEYKCETDEDYADFVSKSYYIDRGKPASMESIKNTLHFYLPEDKFKSSKEDYWAQLIFDTFQKFLGEDPEMTVDKAKAEVVRQAMVEWPFLFSRFFVAEKFCGPGPDGEDVKLHNLIVAVNWRGLFLLKEARAENGKQQLLLELEFRHINKAVCERGGVYVMVQTEDGGEFVFEMPDAEKLRELVSLFLGKNEYSKELDALMEAKKAKRPRPPPDQNNAGGLTWLLQLPLTALWGIASGVREVVKLPTRLFDKDEPQPTESLGT